MADDASLPAMSSRSSPAFNYVDTAASFSVTVRGSEQALMIHIAGELDMLTGPPLKEHLSKLLDTRPERLVVDLSAVTFLGSSGLAVLLGTWRAAAQQGTTLQFSGTNHRAVARPLQITGLDRLFATSPPATGRP